MGLKIKKEETGISVNQDLYAKKIEEVRFDVKERSNTDKLDQDEARLLRELLARSIGLVPRQDQMLVSILWT